MGGQKITDTSRFARFSVSDPSNPDDYEPGLFSFDTVLGAGDKENEVGIIEQRATEKGIDLMNADKIEMFP